MKVAIIIGIICSVLGILGILGSSSLFSGLITLGVFLIVYTLIAQKEKPRTENPAITTNTLFTPQIISFCPNCGSRVESHIQRCPSCGEKLANIVIRNG